MPLAPNFIAVWAAFFMRAAERDPALELRGDVLGDELRVGLGLADLDDVQGTPRCPSSAWTSFLSCLDASAALADDDARARRVDVDLRLVRGALDLD